MRATTPTLHCDAAEGMCGAWDVDYYAVTASAVSGVRITAEQRAPGWVSVADCDFCPRHSREAGDPR